MQQVENSGEEEATVDVQFTDLPNALIAYKVPEDLFNEGSLKVRTFSWWFILTLRRIFSHVSCSSTLRMTILIAKMSYNIM